MHPRTPPKNRVDFLFRGGGGEGKDAQIIGVAPPKVAPSAFKLSLVVERGKKILTNCSGEKFSWKLSVDKRFLGERRSFSSCRGRRNGFVISQIFCFLLQMVEKPKPSSSLVCQNRYLQAHSRFGTHNIEIRPLLQGDAESNAPVLSLTLCLHRVVRTKVRHSHADALAASAVAIIRRPLLRTPLFTFGKVHPLWATLL